MENQLTAKSICTEEGEEYFLIVETGNVSANEKCPRLNLPLTICITDTKLSYTGELTQDQMNNSMKKLKMKDEVFYLYNCEALLDNGSINYSFKLERKSDNSAIFTWKKTHAEKNVKCQLGQLTLRVQETNLLGRVLKMQVDQLRGLNDQITELKSERDRLAKTNEDALATLEECIKVKDNLENELYSKFLAVINTKKEKIRELESKLYENNNNSQPLIGIEVNKSSSSSQSESTTMECEEEEEKEKEEVAPKRSRRTVRKKDVNLPVKSKGVKFSKRSPTPTRNESVEEMDEDDLMANL